MIHLKKIEKKLIEREYQFLKDPSLKDVNEHDLFSNEKLYLLKYSSGKISQISIGQIEKHWYGYVFYEKNGVNFVLNLNPEEKNKESIEEIYEVELLDDSKNNKEEIFII